jgi:3-oxoacyl-[acyl-carrier protein] reductase
MDLELKNKIVILTGATGGIGKQICADFLLEGAIVVAVYRNEDKLKMLMESLTDLKLDITKVYPIKVDVLKKSEIDRCVKEVLLKYSRIDVLINCAGSSFECSFAILDENIIENMIDINLKSPMLFSQSVLKPMFKQKSGCIINVTTVATHKAGRGIVAYASAKSGLDTFTRALAQEVGRKNIRVNTIRPGVIKTEMSKQILENLGDYIIESTAINRIGKPADISSVALFLASEKTASFINGTNINVDGGFNL